VWEIVRSAIAEGSPAVRRLVRHVVFFWIATVALQIWDSRNATGAAGVAEFFSALLAICGIALLGIGGTLRLSMKEAAARGRTGDEAGVARVLLALPTIGFASGLSLGAATILMIVRGALGVELPFAIAGTLLYAALTVAAARTVTQSAATLFEVGTLHATRAAEYRNAAATARFDALQARMNPHVLFNALNTVASLVRSDPPAAERIVHTLGDVLKQTLDRSSDVNGTVAQEIAYVETCLALEKERWGDHLRVSWSIEDEVRDWRMPPFTIQPLVENALRHGLGARIEGGHIAISIRRHGDALVASVTDDGAGFPQRWREGNGIGALRQRLAALYGDKASIAIERAAGRGASVVVRLPKEIARLPLVTTGADGARVDR
jgi:hypothetical protein